MDIKVVEMLVPSSHRSDRSCDTAGSKHMRKEKIKRHREHEVWR